MIGLSVALLGGLCRRTDVGIGLGARLARGMALAGRIVKSGTFAHTDSAMSDSSGPIPEGLTIDHLCRNKDSQRHNVKRTHCKRGHPFTEENTWIRYDRNNGRECHECRRMFQRIAWKRERAAMRAVKATVG